MEKDENLVKKTCRELEISQKELAEKIGVSNNAISNWKNAKTPIPKWAIRSFELIEIESKYYQLRNLLK